MSKSKILRCSVDGCRVLTTNGLCDRHRAPEPAVNESPWSGIRPEEWAAAAIKAERLFGEMVAQRDTAAARRSDLAALRDGAEKAAMRLERPIFSGGAENGL